MRIYFKIPNNCKESKKYVISNRIPDEYNIIEAVYTKRQEMKECRKAEIRNSMRKKMIQKKKDCGENENTISR